MSRHPIATAFITASLFLMPVVTRAALTPESSGLSQAARGTGLTTSCTGTDCLLNIVGNVINLVLGFLGVVLLVMLLYAGFLWMTSGGKMEGVEAAKNMIRNAVAGIIIVASSYAISAFVLGQLATIAGDSGAGGGEGGAADSCVSFDCGSTASGLCSEVGLAGCEEYDLCCR